MKKFVAELSGTLLIVLAVSGSAFLAHSLTKDSAIQLLLNCISTSLVLYISIELFSSMSGAHFNPIVSILTYFNGAIQRRDLLSYIVAQICGALLGAGIANVMFSAPIFSLSTIHRESPSTLIGEVISAMGLIVVIFAQWNESIREKRSQLIALWIASAYFFTSSTSFANPVVSLGRVFTSSPAGIDFRSFVGFGAAQFIGGFLAFTILRTISKSSVNR